MSETADYPLLHEEAEAMDIESGKTKMAFAKMQSTQALRDLCMLTDADFESARDDDEVSSTKIDNMNDGGQLGFTNNSESGLETVFESANSRASTTASPIRLNDSDSLNITTQSFETTELNNSADDSLILPNGTITDNNGDDTIQAMPKNSNPNTTSNKGSKSSGGGGGGVKKQNSSNLSKPMKVSSDVVSSKQSLHQTNPTIGDEALPATTQQQVDTTPTGDGTRKQSKVTPSNKELTASLSLYSSPKNP